MAATASALSGRPPSLDDRPRNLNSSRSVPLEVPGPQWGGDGVTGSALSLSRAQSLPPDAQHGGSNEAAGASAAMRRSLQELAQALQSSTPHGYNGRIHDANVRRLPPGSLPPMQQQTPRTAQWQQQQMQQQLLQQQQLRQRQEFWRQQQQQPWQPAPVPPPPQPPRSSRSARRSDASELQLHALEAGVGVGGLDDMNGPPGVLNEGALNRGEYSVSAGVNHEGGDMGWLNMCNAVLALLFFLLLYVTGNAWVRAIRKGDFGGVGISTCLLAMLMYACCRRRAGDPGAISNAEREREREQQAAWVAGTLEEVGNGAGRRGGSSLHRLQRGVTDLKRAEFSYFVYEADGTLTQLVGAARPVAFAADGGSVALAGGNKSSAGRSRNGGGGGGGGSRSNSSGNVAAVAAADKGIVAVAAGEGSNSDKDKDKEKEAQDQDCAICLGDYEAHEQLCRLPCGHLFHTECLFQWLDEHRNCPLCKHDLMCSGDDSDSSGSSRALDAFASFAAAAAAAAHAEVEAQEEAVAAAAAAARAAAAAAVVAVPEPAVPVAAVAVVEPLSPVAPLRRHGSGDEASGLSPRAPFR